MKKLVIACNVDGVLNNPCEHILKVFNEKTRDNLSVDDFKHYDIYRCLEYDDARYFEQLMQNQNNWNDLAPDEGSQAVLSRIVQDGHHVYLVTSTKPSEVEFKWKWVKRYFPYWLQSNFVVLKDKHRFDCDVMIDDCFESLIKGCTYHRVVFDRPWNRGYREDTVDSLYGITRARNWNDVYKTINNIAEMEESDV